MAAGRRDLTYAVKAPSVEGTYTFSGVLRDSYMAEEEIGGASEVTVSALPEPTPAMVTTSDSTAPSWDRMGVEFAMVVTLRPSGTLRTISPTRTDPPVAIGELKIPDDGRFSLIVYEAVEEES